MKIRYYLAASMASLATSMVMAPQVAAQQITSGMEGEIESADGSPIAGATVTIVDERTGQQRTVTTGNAGRFSVGSLTPGGPYTITATANGFEGQSLQNQMINLQGSTSYTFALTPVSSATDVIVVDAQRVRVTQLAVGPSLSFGSDILEGFPSISRDIRDIIRIDPRVSLDRENDVERISCLGGNDRTNTFTVDGVVQADSFGLNGTPFAARNALPLPYDVIRETSVEFAPFDVEYSDFTGCLINVVTKSGQNDFHGSAFITYRDSGMRGSTVDGQSFVPAEFQEKRWGATLSGPIVQDRLFFLFGYEETDLGDSNDIGPAGGGFPNDADYVTIDQFNRFAQIANDVYGQDVGGYPRSLPESSVRYFGRLDAIINDDHRLELTYQRLEETNVESDTGTNELTGLNSFEDEGTISDYYAARLFSDWSDTVSTELHISRSEVGDVQGPVGFGEAQSDNPTVRLSVGVVGPDENGILSTGPGIFRSANQLDTKVDQAKFIINIDDGDHQFKFGAEVSDLEVYNLFAINATGTLYFRNLDDFEQGLVAASTGGSNVFGDADDLADGSNGGGTIAATDSGDINDAAARFSRQIYALYAQDQWQATDQLSITGGVRFQWYAGDAPRANPTFQNRYGFSNSVSFGDIKPIIMPRLAATYEFDNDGFFSNSSLKAGIGAYSGGDPVVYFSNAFSNNGFSTGTGDTFSSQCAGLLDSNGQFDVVQNGQFTGFPQCAVTAASAQSAAGLADTQSTDPNFDIPVVWRANLGFSTMLGEGVGFFDNWSFNVDYIYSHFTNTINFVDLSQTIDIRKGLNGYTVDGRPIYAAIDPTAAGCDALLQGSGGTPPVWANVTAACFNTRRDDEIQLTNGRNYDSHVVSAVLAKTFDGGVFTDAGSTQVSFGYAFTDSNNFRNANSSTATSSYDESAAFDRQNPRNGTSNYETRHRFTVAMNFTEEFFSEYDTQLALFFSAQSGRPYSLTFDGGGVFGDSSSGNDNALLYIPSGLNDANLSPSSDPAAVQSLLDYVAGLSCASGFSGETIVRNTCTEDWVYDLDMRISQEIPGPGSLFGMEDRIQIFADFDNVLNMIDSSWNTQRARGIFGDGQLVDIVDGGVDSAGRYIISGFNPDDTQQINVSASAWRIQIGARYEF
ncbi:TonB-dependent receptor [Alteraurantiacibacter aestuarii]|uniref:TonB-dependent receptor n=1 Tax=Alteraurantiacibacter aestuarii TaxID=650004 RepID=A0A844ZQ67_9SPHN|nr:carboxypeptidase regulatory-like domain-containing protein [Alteraurantiacibacter aestuarii]MXO89186.1 TonB-dependent receptor [Alteraurantiacibacter aestuarii]